MPLDTIYITRHGHRLNWTIDLSTGTYHATYPTPTGIPVDPTLTQPGVRQSQELAAHFCHETFTTKPCRVYCSPFYRCLQTIQPTVEGLKKIQEAEKRPDINLTVRIENGLGEWFGSSSFFTHPSPSTPEVLATHFPTILSPSPSETQYKARIIPSPSGETIAQLHDRVATTLSHIIATVDEELAAFAESHPDDPRNHQSHSILICTHAAPLIAMGRALTGNMPDDSSEEDFKPFTASVSTFARRKSGSRTGIEQDVVNGKTEEICGKKIPHWRGGRGVGGGWDCVQNGDCSFLSGGEERGWHFNGEEDFLSMPTPLVASAPSGAASDAGSAGSSSAKL
ncbi:hypothetical protein D8B26_005592 [Coccidioides posadasii str. Silveira]|uniref:Phosphoglycerate mutase n=4 Tax=Coccidioides TaxID=5500 RepID=E9D3Y7_COCPS|nr:phosphoglycerate mutase [Coccidioides posadasii str. Silveira]KMM72420.1 hypothetical protein CPAG_08714 [Coccidioides posadasii RMSCC 3488]QVM10941.1 hypothetical protein D8B26_005592 [Coccidioides posadasii str. Silveira]